MAVKFNKFMVLTALAVLVLILPACSRDKQEQKVEKTEENTIITEKPEHLPEVVSIAGKVLQVENTGGFIFILLDRGDKQIWATVPSTDLTVGEKITLRDANIFENFYSKSMDRTFDELIFASAIEGKSSKSRFASRPRKSTKVTSKTPAKPAAANPSAGQ